MTNLCLSLLSDAAVYFGLPLGLWISFRILSFPDLSLEQLFVMGGVLYAKFSEMPLYLLLTFSIFGLLSGFGSSLLRNRLKIHPIIISLSASYLYYSLALIILGGPSHYLGNASKPALIDAGLTAALLFLAVSSVIVLSSRTRAGLNIIATASNPQLAKRYGISPLIWQGLGLSIGFTLPMLSGALFVWRNANVDVSYGSGFLLISIFTVVATHATQPRIRSGRNCLTLLIFLLLYLSLLQGALMLGMPPQWFKGITAVALLALVLIIPKDRSVKPLLM